MIDRIHKLLAELNALNLDGKAITIIMELLVLVQCCVAQNRPIEKPNKINTPKTGLESSKTTKERKEPKERKYIYNNITPLSPLPSGQTPSSLDQNLFSLDEIFTIFWKVYPRREAKGAAARALRSALTRATADVIIDGARRYAAERKGQDKRYTAMAATWLNQDRWLDEPPTASVFYADPPMPKRSWAEIQAEQASNVVAFPGVRAAEAFIAAGGMDPVPMEGSDLDALVCGDDEGAQGSPCSEEPRASGLLDILPALQAMDHSEEN